MSWSRTDVTRLDGAAVHLNATGHLVISYAGYVHFCHLRKTEAEIFRAVHADKLAAQAEYSAKAEGYKNRVMVAASGR
jgi:hypothetical protein